MPAPLVFSVDGGAQAADLQTVDSGLDAHNRAEPELAHVEDLHVLARSPAGVVVGGAIGRTWGRCCELLQLWVREDERGRGAARRLMALFEQEAGRRGCTLVYLSTFSFQAPGFYARLGYDVVLETEGFSGGIVKYTMHKTLLVPGPPRA
jgi:N-acetylglutamate synthase-like GNAT family acetyltransferase